PGNSQNLLLLRVRDAKTAAATFDRAGGANAPENFHGTLLHPVGDGSVAGLKGGWAYVGARDAVHAALASGPKLGSGKTFNDLVGGLPDDRVGDAWLSQAGLRAPLAGPAAILAGAAQVPALQSAAVGFGDDGKLMRLAFRARPSAAPGGAARP